MIEVIIVKQVCSSRVSFFVLFLMVSLHLFLEVCQDQMAGILDVGIVLTEVYIKDCLLSFLWSLKPPPK